MYMLGMRATKTVFHLSLLQGKYPRKNINLKIYIHICKICDETASLPFCPVCKTENYIKRMVE